MFDVKDVADEDLMECCEEGAGLRCGPRKGGVFFSLGKLFVLPHLGGPLPSFLFTIAAAGGGGGTSL
jgi:hypothetical protein